MTLHASGIDGLGDTKHIFGTIAAREKVKQEREDKVSRTRKSNLYIINETFTNLVCDIVMHGDATIMPSYSVSW